MANEYELCKDRVEATNPAMAKLQGLVERAEFLSDKIAQLEAEEETLKKELRELTCTTIPALMDTELCLEEVKTPDGVRVQIKEDVESNISQERKTAALTWLEVNGHAALIKRNITVAFNREQSEEASKLVQELAKTYPGVDLDSKVHPSTLKSWVKAMLEEGKPFPLDLFGVFRRRTAKITKDKKK